MMSSRRTASVSAVVLMLAGILTLAAQWRLAAEHPTESAWRAGAAFVKTHIERGDVVRVSPSWTETPLPYLQSLGTSISRQEYPVREDFMGVERVWVISDRDRRETAVERLPFELKPKAVETSFTQGNVAVLSVELPAEQLPEKSLLEVLPDAEVYIEGPDGEKRACDRWDETSWRWRCTGGGARSWVGRDLRYFADDAHRCIRAYPPSGDRTLVVTFPELPAGGMFRLRAGLTTLTALADKGSSVTMTLDSNVLPSREVVFDKDTAGWDARDIGLPKGERVSLEIGVKAKNTHKRYFCFNGWTYGDSAGGEWTVRPWR